LKKTKDAVNFLKVVGAYDDAAKVKNTKRIRPGKGKSRNRRYKLKKGPLVVFAKDDGIVRAFRNIPGVDTLHIDALDLLELAPGGHVGRFIIWTESAFKALTTKFGTYGLKGDAALHRRNGTPYQLPRPVMVNTDTEKIIQSDEVQNVVRPPQPQKNRRIVKKNPLKNLAGLIKLNPYAIIEQRMKTRARPAPIPS
jgi:large subunit ribosomal protein L4e